MSSRNTHHLMYILQLSPMPLRSQVERHLDSLLLTQRADNQFWVHCVLILCCCCNELRQHYQQLKTTQLYSVTILQVTNMGWLGCFLSSRFRKAEIKVSGVSWLDSQQQPLGRILFQSHSNVGPVPYGCRTEVPISFLGSSGTLSGPCTWPLHLRASNSMLNPSLP